MANTRVAHRYAQALMGLAEEQGTVENVAKDLELLHKTVKESREFALFLKSPVITRDKKKNILQSLFGQWLHPVTLQFILLLTEKGREDLLELIFARFLELRNELLGIVEVDVRSATELQKDQNAELQHTFERYTKKKVAISFSVDKQLKGGFVARIGDTVFDGSIKRQLELLREKFAEGQT